MGIELGDIVLIRSDGFASDLNLRCQSLLRRVQANYTHVAICDGLGGFLHCTVDAGVAFEHFTDVIGDDQSYIAYRSDNVNKFAKSNRDHFVEMLTYNLGKAYLRSVKNRNMPRAIREYANGSLSEGETFCSELIFRIITAAGENIKTEYRSVLPCDFERFAAEINWTDVTQQHIDYYSSPMVRDLESLWRDTNAARNFVRLGQKQTDFMIEIITSIDKIAKRIDKIAGFIPSPPLEGMDLGERKYWDQKYYRID